MEIKYEEVSGGSTFARYCVSVKKFSIYIAHIASLPKVTEFLKQNIPSLHNHTFYTGGKPFRIVRYSSTAQGGSIQ